MCFFFCFCVLHSSCSHVTSHLSTPEADFLSWRFEHDGGGDGKESKKGGTESYSGLETRYCLACRTASQPGSSVRERQREPEGGREGEGATVAMVTWWEMRAHLFICGLRERARWALSSSRCVRVCVFIRAWLLSVRTCADSPGLKGWPTHCSLCKQTQVRLMEAQLTWSKLLSQHRRTDAS